MLWPTRIDRFTLIDPHIRSRYLERKASYYGEGLHVEFKAFIEPEQKLRGPGDYKSKLLEIVTTVIRSFARRQNHRDVLRSVEIA